MSQKKYIVELTEVEVKELESIIKTGKHSAMKITRARILLEANEGKSDLKIAETVRVNISTVERMREKYVFATSLEEALKDRPHPPRGHKLDGKGEAFLIATACSDAPEGRATWTMQLLADRLVDMQLVDSISDETVRKTLKKTKLNLG